MSLTAWSQTASSSSSTIIIEDEEMRWTPLCLLLLQLVGTHFRYMAGNKGTAEYYYFPCFSGARDAIVMGQQY